MGLVKRDGDCGVAAVVNIFLTSVFFPTGGIKRAKGRDSRSGRVLVPPKYYVLLDENISSQGFRGSSVASSCHLCIEYK